MQIRELYLKNFGKFSEKRFMIADGIHIIYGENEFGKSTIYAFIKAMLFGLERGRGRASKQDIFSRYEPWNNPNYYAGVMRFTCGERNFRLERNFDRYTKSASLVCEDDGEELSVEDGDLDMLLEGMTPSSFENTIAIGQMAAAPNQELSAALKNYAANYYATGNSEIDLQGALKELKEKRKSVEIEIKKLTSKKDSERKKIELQIHYVEEDMNRMQERYRLLEEEMVSFAGKAAVEPEKRGAAVKILWAAAATVFPLLLLAALWPKGPWNLICAAAVLTAELLGAGWLRRRKKQAEERPVQEKQAELQWDKQRIQAELQEKQVLFQNLQENLQELHEMGDTYVAQQTRCQALDMAYEQLGVLSREVGKEFGRRLNETASGILSEITDGTYTNLIIDGDLSMFLLTKDGRIAVERVSRGTIEQVYFALRMAAAELLYEEEFPVILDDAFAFYDEHRLKSTLKWLSNHKRQVIIFTCQKREMTMRSYL